MRMTHADSRARKPRAAGLASAALQRGLDDRFPWFRCSSGEFSLPGLRLHLGLPAGLGGFRTSSLLFRMCDVSRRLGAGLACLRLLTRGALEPLHLTFEPLVSRPRLLEPVRLLGKLLGVFGGIGP